MDHTVKYIRKKEIIESKIDDDYVLMSLEKNGYYGLNSVASRIWDLLKEAQSIDAIVEVLLKEYNVEKTVCIKETNALIEALKKSGLIQKA